VPPTELTQAWEVEGATVPASTREDAECLVRRLALLEGELAEARRAQEVTEEKFCHLSDASAIGAR
jgi:hypothetical protein